MNRVISGDMQEKTSAASSGVKGLATVRVDEISMFIILALSVAPARKVLAVNLSHVDGCVRGGVSRCPRRSLDHDAPGV